MTLVLRGELLRGKESSFELEKIYWLAEKKARVDFEGSSDIVDLEKGVLYGISHQDAVVFERPIPVDIESESEHPTVVLGLRRILREYDPALQITRLEQPQELDGRSMTVYTTQIGSLQSAVRGTFKMWADEAVDERLTGAVIRQLDRNRLATSPYTAKWMYKATWPPAGFPVRLEADFEINGLRSIYVRTLRSIREVSVPADHFAPPGDYSRRDTYKVIRRVRAKPLPPPPP
jgi:hypothetical protein